MLFLSGMGTEYPYQFDDLFRKIEQLEAVVRSQQQTIEVQQERIKQLESALAAAKKNSSNSSKPPSSDIVKPKPIEIFRMRVRLPCGKTDFHRALWRIFQPAWVFLESCLRSFWNGFSPPTLAAAPES